MSGNHAWLLFEAIRKAKGGNLPERGALLVENGSKLFVKNRSLACYLDLMRNYGMRMKVPLALDNDALRKSLRKASVHRYTLKDTGTYYSGYVFLVPAHFPSHFVASTEEVPKVQIEPVLVEAQSKSALIVPKKQSVKGSAASQKASLLSSHVIEHNFTYTLIATLTFDFGKVWISRHAFRKFKDRLCKWRPKKAQQEDYLILLELVAVLKRSVAVHRRNTVFQIIRYGFREAQYRITDSGQSGEHWIFVLSPEGLLYTAYMKGWIRELYYRA